MFRYENMFKIYSKEFVKKWHNDSGIYNPWHSERYVFNTPKWLLKCKQDDRKYECVKEIAKALRKNFKGMQANSYGYCCPSDYDYYHNYTNDKDYVCCKLFKGGLNNDYHNGRFDVGASEYYMWGLTEFKLSDVIKVMQNIAFKYGYRVIAPPDESKCIELRFEMGVQ